MGAMGRDGTGRRAAVVRALLAGAVLALALGAAARSDFLATLTSDVFGVAEESRATDATTDARGASDDELRATRLRLAPTRSRDRSRAPDALDEQASGDATPEEPEAAAKRDDRPQRHGLSRLALLSEVPLLELLDFAALPAAPDTDPATGTAPEVEPGNPQRMEIETFAALGTDAVEEAVELVGERRPHLEEGVPVALRGRVLEAGTGDPLPGATVILTSTFYVRHIQYDHHLREVARAVTDEDGAYFVERLNADPAHFGRGGRLYLTVTSPSHAPALARPVATVSPGKRNKLPDVELEREVHTLRGRLVGIWDGKPVVGARVIATGAVNPIAYPKDQRAALFVGAPETVSDADGRFELAGLGRGVQNVSAHGGNDCLGVVRFSVPGNDEVTVRVRPIRGRIEGRVVDESGQPVPLAYVDGGGNSTHSFADGTFVLENFHGDVVTLRVSHGEFRPLALAGIRDGRTGLEARLTSRWPALHLAVRRGDTDAAVEEVEVLLVFTGEERPPLPASRVHIAKDGVHVVRVPAGVVRVTIIGQEQGLLPAGVAVQGRLDGDVVDVVLEPRP